MQEVTMKRNAILLAMLSFMAIWLSGCILSSSPATDTVIKLATGESQMFSVTGKNNGPYQWYKNEAPIPGATGTSYTYQAVSADLGEFSIMVVTTDKLSGSLLSVTWTVKVVEDLPPVANAGPDQELALDGSTVYLNGSSSFDPESRALSYIWEIVSQPSGSTCSLDNPGAMMPTFVPDVEGVYTIRLIVNDGRLNSIGDAVNISVYNNFAPPVANAGADQNVLYGNSTVLDGTASIDYSGHGLTYQWTIDSGPAGSAATLDDATKSQPVFSPDLKGMYVLSLEVYDGRYTSNVDWVVVTVYNIAPIARAGSDVLVPNLGGTAYIDGSASSDPDGTALAYSWTLTSKPTGSSAALIGADTATPTLVCDKKGAYLVALTVSDGDLSGSDMIMVTCSNQVPVADAGPDMTIPFLSTATLSGSGSDPDGDPVTFEWAVVSAPVGSTAALSNPNIANPTFTPDMEGEYVLSLIVTDNDVPPISSAPDYMTIYTSNHPPVANAGSDININLTATATLSGSGTDMDGDPIVGYAWTIINTPFGSTAAISDPNISDPAFTPDLRGDYTIGLSVFDGTEWSAVDTMQVHVFNNRPVAVATTSTPQPTHWADRAVQLSGAGSYDPDGDPILGYRWEVISKPEGSTATFNNDLIVNPIVTLDIWGTYEIGLYVNDGMIESTAGTVTLTCSQGNMPITNWDDNVKAPWFDEYSSGSMGTKAIATDQKYSGTRSYKIEGCNGTLGFGCTSGAYRVAKPFTNTFILSVGMWARGSCGKTIECTLGGQYVTPDVDLYVDGVYLQDLGNIPDGSWGYNEVAINRLVNSSVGIHWNSGDNNGNLDSWWDDIVFTIWD